jgi:uncharacterized membrane protein HdeD (DUF308 family)
MTFKSINIWRASLIIFQLFFIFFTIAAVASALIWHRQNAHHYASWGALIATAAIVWGTIMLVIRGPRPALWQVPFVLCISAVSGYFFVLIGYSLISATMKIYEFATSPAFSTEASIAVVGLGTLAVGMLLFVFRLKWRCLYGASEAVVGVIVASQRFYHDAVTTNTPAPFLVLAILTAGVYLVVRGADNIHQGLTKEPLDPFGQQAIRWLDSFGQNRNWRTYWIFDDTDKKNLPLNNTTAQD